MFETIDWAKVFLPDTPVLEIVVRGTVMYLSLFTLLRVVLKRQAGSIGLPDILVIVLISDAAQNGMAGQYQSIMDGVLLVATIISWSFALDWLDYRFPRIQRLLRPAPLLLIRDGRMLRRNMRRELVTDEELNSQLRQQGFDDVSEIKEGYIESDGEMSFIPFEKKG
ncbi:MAG: DUF421 domain-containing protein [Acidobacteria bacterium]|nr:MAG: DUF421 domain-containing protein [Acidobacteriota bacterium]